MAMKARAFVLKAGRAAVVAVAAAASWPTLAADPYPAAADKSTIQFAFTTDAPRGTLIVTMGRRDVEAWEQPAYPGGRPTFTLAPGRYPIEFPGDPALHFVDAKPQTVTIVTIGRSPTASSGYRIVEQRDVAPSRLPAADQGAAPLGELGPAVSFVIRPGAAAPTN